MRVALVGATVVAAGLGTAELAAHQVAFIIWTLLALVLDAVAIAAQALVGRALGAADVDAAWSTTRRMVQWGLLAGAALGLVVAASLPSTHGCSPPTPTYAPCWWLPSWWSRSCNRSPGGSSSSTAS